MFSSPVETLNSSFSVWTTEKIFTLLHFELVLLWFKLTVAWSQKQLVYWTFVNLLFNLVKVIYGYTAFIFNLLFVIFFLFRKRFMEKMRKQPSDFHLTPTYLMWSVYVSLWTADTIVDRNRFRWHWARVSFEALTLSLKSSVFFLPLSEILQIYFWRTSCLLNCFLEGSQQVLFGKTVAMVNVHFIREQ